MLRETDPSLANVRFRQSIEYLNRIVAETNLPVYRATRAEFLAVCPDPAVRDTGRGLAEAQRASRESPNDRNIRRVLSVCLYEAGRYTEALDASEVPPRRVGEEGHVEVEGIDQIYRAMILWKVGRRKEAGVKLREVSSVLHRSWRTTRRAWLAHDQAWRLIESSEPPARNVPVSVPGETARAQAENSAGLDFNAR